MADKEAKAIIACLTRAMELILARATLEPGDDPKREIMHIQSIAARTLKTVAS